MADLHGIIENGNLDELRSALTDETDINQSGHCGATPGRRHPPEE